MTTPRPDPFDPILVRTTRDLRRLGESESDVDEDGRPLWTKVRRGSVVLAKAWHDLTPEQRHSAFIHATAHQMQAKRRPTFSHTSAAALHRLPRVTAWPDRVDVLVAGRKAHSSGRIRRIVVAPTDPDDPSGVAEVHGLRVTSLARTIIDVARTEDLRDAVAAADHALHHELCTRPELNAELGRLSAGARGRARAEFVVRFAEPGAMSVGESLSRVQMFRLGLPRPTLQYAVHDAEGQIGVVDFWWEDEGLVGEFDGRKKYGIALNATPEEMERALWREKRREDRIRATGRKMARWVWDDAMHPMQLAARLTEQGLERRAKDTWFDAA